MTCREPVRKNTRERRREQGQSAALTVAFYQSGVSLQFASSGGAGSSPDAKRGQVEGWSTASRRRLRKYLMTHKCKAGYKSFAVSLTVPGPVLDGEDIRKIWKHFRTLLSRRDWGCVWRLECQERGQMHWHLVLSCPEAVEASEVVSVWMKVLSARTIDLPTKVLGVADDDRWKFALSDLWMMPHSGSEFVRLSEWFGADKFACIVEPFVVDSRNRWIRYLMDHTSKSKQAQIVQVAGWRHWGKVREDCFTAAEPEDFYELSGDAAVLFRRAVNRLRTPQCFSKRKGCVFGRALGRPAGLLTNRGSRVLFGSPETYERLARWAIFEAREKVPF